MLWQKATSLSCYNISSCGENPFSWDTGPWNTKVAFCLKRQKWVLSLMHTPPLKWIFWERYRCNLPVFGNFFLCPVCSTCVDSGSCSHWCIGCPKQIHKRTGFFWSLWWGGVTITKGFLLLYRCTDFITSNIRSLLLTVTNKENVNYSNWIYCYLSLPYIIFNYFTMIYFIQ